MRMKRNRHVLYFMTHISKKNEIENLQQYIENEKDENKILQLFMNDLKTLKKIYNTRRRS